MPTISTENLPLWTAFDEAARRQQRDPAELLTDYMRECLEIWAEQALDDEIRAALVDGPPEEDAEGIVRQYRREKAAKRASA